MKRSKIYNKPLDRALRFKDLDPPKEVIFRPQPFLRLIDKRIRIAKKQFDEGLMELIDLKRDWENFERELRIKNASKSISTI